MHRNHTGLGAAAPTAGEIQDAVDRIVAEGPYNLERTVWWDFEFFWWLGDLVEWALGPLIRLGEAVGEAGGWVMWLVVILLLALLAGILAHIVYVVLFSRRGADEPALEFETGGRLDPAALRMEAERLAEAGDFAGAIRTLYKTALVMLEAKRGGRFRSGLTNHEYMNTFKSDWVVENLRVFVQLINWKWYANLSFEPRDYERCAEAFAELESKLAEVPDS